MASINELSPKAFTTPTDQFDLVFSPTTLTSKLDADQYMAEDLDGGTESLFGSGNMNFLAMQAGQTNEAMRAVAEAEASDPFESFAINEQMPIGSLQGLVSSAVADELGNRTASFEPHSVSGNSALLLDRAAQNAETGFSNNRGDFNETADAFDGTSGRSGISGTSGTSGINGQSFSGTNGTDGNDGTGTTIINNEYTFIDLGDVTELVDNTVTNVTHLTENLVENLTEIINNITDIDIINKLKNIFHEIFGDPDNPDHDLGLQLGITEGILPIDLPPVDLNQLLNPVEDIIGDVDIGIVGGIDLLGNSETDNQAGDTDINIIGDNGLLGTGLLGTNLNIALDAVEQFTGDIDLDVTSAANLLGTLAPGLIDNFVGGSGGPLGDVGTGLTNIAAPVLGPIVGNSFVDLSGNLNLLDPTAGGADSNLHVGVNLQPLGIQLPPVPVDVPFGQIEGMTDPNLAGVGTVLTDLGLGGGAAIIPGILGGQPHTDTDLGLANDISIAGNDIPLPHLSPVLNPVEDLAGDLDVSEHLGLDLFGSNEVINSMGDSDVNVTTNIEVVDHALVELSPSIPLDPVEQIVGDIDLNLGVSDNLLGNIAAPVVDTATGGSGSGLLANIGDQLGNGVQQNFTPEWHQIFSEVLNASHQLDTHVDQITNLLTTNQSDGGFHPFDLLQFNRSDDGHETIAWPQSVLPHGSDSDHFADNLLGALPDPVGDVTSGLSGVLDHATHNTPLSKLGGLFG